MTNSAKTRPTPAFDKKIEKQRETAPSFGHPTQIREDRGPGAKRPKFRIPRREELDTGKMTPGVAPVVGAQLGGGERNRTVDLLLAKQALSQLSYTPGSDVR